MLVRPGSADGLATRRAVFVVFSGALAALSLFAGVALGGQPARATPGGIVATAAKTKTKPYCSPRIRHHCVKVPKAARRPTSINEQGPPDPRADTPDAGGVGG